MRGLTISATRLLYFAVDVPHDELTVTAESIVKVAAPKTPAPASTPPWEQAPRRELDGPHGGKAAQFTFESPLIRFIDEARDYALRSFAPGRPLLEAALDLTSRIFREFKYDPTASCVNTPTEEILRKRRGVCQDFAHLEITCLRSLGLAARYVSGYLLTDPPAGQPKLVGADASHAWLSVYLSAAELLDRSRPDQQSDPPSPPRHTRLGPRLQRRLPDQRRLSRRRRPPHVRLRRCLAFGTEPSAFLTVWVAQLPGQDEHYGFAENRQRDRLRSAEWREGRGPRSLDRGRAHYRNSH